VTGTAPTPSRSSPPPSPPPVTTEPSPARRHRSPPPSVSPRGAGGGDLTSKGDPLSKGRAATDGGGVPNLGAVPHAGPLTGNSPPGKGGGLASKDIVSPMAGATATFTGGTVSDNTCTGPGRGHPQRPPRAVAWQRRHRLHRNHSVQHTCQCRHCAAPGRRRLPRNGTMTLTPVGRVPRQLRRRFPRGPRPRRLTYGHEGQRVTGDPDKGAKSAL
jgi:hypothetical protein